MGDLSKNFSRSEFKCKCGECEQVGPDPKLIEELQKIRDHFHVPMKIHSGHRCQKYNESVGGASRSQHLKGTAADFTLEGISNNQVQEYVLRENYDRFGIGRYRGFTHLDVRGYVARWDNR